MRLDVIDAVDVYIARHGETTWNAAGRYQGRIDSPLSALGEAQAAALAGALAEKNIGRIVSSPLSRCVRTALPLAMQLRIEIETDPLLLEIAHGTWEGRYRSEIAANEPERYRTWREHPERVAFEGGESLAEVFGRWKQFAAGFTPLSNTLIVTHDIVVRCALLERRGRPISELRAVRALNAAYAWFQVDGGDWILREECAAGHLP